MPGKGLTSWLLFVMLNCDFVTFPRVILGQIFATFSTWSFEVKCLQKVEYIPDHVILQSICKSLKGSAQDFLVPVGENSTIEDILSKLKRFYDNVIAGEILIQSF